MTTPELETDDVSSDLGGQYLRQADFEDGNEKVFTIARVEKTLFEAKNGRPEERKWVVTFTDDRSLSLNRTNLALLAKWFGKHAHDWVNQRIIVYRDESISFGGRLVGGLRVRRPLATDRQDAVDESASKRKTAGRKNRQDAVDESVPF